MTIHRFFFDPTLFKLNQREIILPDEVSFQIRKVLRLEDGDRIILCDGKGNEYLCELIRHSGKVKDTRQGTRMTVRIVEKRKNQKEPEIKLTLYQALIPREKFEDVLEKCTEIGVSKFVPLETARAQIHAKNIDEKKLARWQKIVKEAAEQSERGIVPQVLSAIKFEHAIEKALKEGKVLVAWENEKGNVIARSETTWQSQGDPHGLRPQDDKNKGVSLFIGPEGGFHEDEIKFAHEKGATTITLGKRILRSETAGIVGSSMLLT